jgi:peroxiredoxin
MKYLLTLSFSFLVIILLSGNVMSQTLTEKLNEKRAFSKKKTPPDIKKIMSKGVSDLRDSGLHKLALGIGQKVPTVNFKNSNNKLVELSEYYGEKVVVLTFYRGGWCPYCMLELESYQKNLEDFEKAGALVIAVSPDSVMNTKKTKKKRKLGFEVLSDPENRAAKKFGLAFKVDKGTLEVYKKFGIDLKMAQDNKNFELPIPGTYVIDKQGVVRFSFVDPDYTNRADPKDVLKVVQEL